MDRFNGIRDGSQDIGNVEIFDFVPHVLFLREGSNFVNSLVNE